MKTKRPTTEVEVPEDIKIEKKRLESIARAILFEPASQDITKLL